MIATRRWLAAAVLAMLAPTAWATPPIVNVCWDYGCDRNARVIVPEQAWTRIRALFHPAAPDPAAERDRIAQAIALFEQAVGPLTGTDHDHYENVVGAGRPGQMDCIDESRNTDGYLRALAERGLLAWHDVGERHERLVWILDQHWTAVVIDRTDGKRWAIDSWFLDNGKRPYVQRLDAWLAKAPLPPNPDAADGQHDPPASRSADERPRDGSPPALVSR